MPQSKHRRRRGRTLPRGARSAGSLAAPRPRKKGANKLYLIAAVVIAVLVIGSFGLTALPSGGGAGNTGGASQYIEGVGEPQVLMPTRNHVPGSQKVSYSTTPPTSGDHWVESARCGFYPEGLADELIVHNLEHGNIIVSYNLTDQEETERLRTVVDGIGLSRLWGVVRAYDQIPEGQVALATWGVMDIMEGVDSPRIEKFFEYAGRLGPESEPC